MPGSKTNADIRRERYAIKFWECMNSREAALYAGVKNGPGLDVAASRLLNDSKVQAKLAELKAKQEKKSEISKQRVLDELSILGFADMKDYAEVLEGGVIRVKPFSELPEGATRAVKKLKEKRSIRADNTGDGDETIIDVAMEFEHHSKIDALKEISKLSGYYPETGTGETSVTVKIVKFSDAGKS